MSRPSLHHECPSCECGKIELSWSDRRALVFPDDVDAIAGVVANCALDHVYDRPGTGVPYGLRNNKLEDALAAVVAKHLVAADLNWRDVSVSMSAEQRERFVTELKDAVAAEIKS